MVRAYGNILTKNYFESGGRGQGERGKGKGQVPGVGDRGTGKRTEDSNKAQGSKLNAESSKK